MGAEWHRVRPAQLCAPAATQEIQPVGYSQSAAQQGSLDSRNALDKCAGIVVAELRLSVCQPQGTSARSTAGAGSDAGDATPRGRAGRSAAHHACRRADLLQIAVSGSWKSMPVQHVRMTCTSCCHDAVVTATCDIMQKCLLSQVAQCGWWRTAWTACCYRTAMPSCGRQRGRARRRPAAASSRCAYHLSMVCRHTEAHTDLQAAVLKLSFQWPHASQGGAQAVACCSAASSGSDLRAEPVAREQFRQGQQLYAFSDGGRLERGGALTPVQVLLADSALWLDRAGLCWVTVSVSAVAGCQRARHRF